MMGRRKQKRASKKQDYAIAQNVNKSKLQRRNRQLVVVTNNQDIRSGHRDVGGVSSGTRKQHQRLRKAKRGKTL